MVKAVFTSQAIDSAELSGSDRGNGAKRWVDAVVTHGSSKWRSGGGAGGHEGLSERFTTLLNDDTRRTCPRVGGCAMTLAFAQSPSGELDQATVTAICSLQGFDTEEAATTQETACQAVCERALDDLATSGPLAASEIANAASEVRRASTALSVARQNLANLV